MLQDPLHMLCDMSIGTSNMRGYECKTRQGEKNQGKGPTEGKRLQQYSCIDCINNYLQGKAPGWVPYFCKGP